MVTEDQYAIYWREWVRNTEKGNVRITINYVLFSKNRFCPENAVQNQPKLISVCIEALPFIMKKIKIFKVCIHAM